MGLSRPGAVISLLASAVASGCSAEPGASGTPDFGDPPPFTGAPPAGAGGVPSVSPPVAGGGTGIGTGVVPPSTEGNPSPTTPVANGAGGARAGVGLGAGGSSPTAVGTAGSGGSTMVGMGGGGGLPASSDPDGLAGAGPGAPGEGETAEPPPGGFYLIDDFEGGRDPQWTESEVGGGAGNFTIDTAVGANGSSSSLRVDSNNAFHTMLQFALPQAVRDVDEVFGRVFLRLAQTPNAAHFIWVEVGNTVNDQHEMRLGHNVGQLQSNHFLNGEQDIRDQSRALVADRFYCIEFQMANDPDELRVWLDGEETALSTTNYTAGAGAQGNTNPIADFIPPLEAFRIGWELQNGTVWFDDVALADSRVGCD